MNLETFKTFFAGMGAALLMLASALFGFLLFRKRSPPAEPTSTTTSVKQGSDALAASGETAVASLESQAAAQIAQGETAHAQATQALEESVASQANGLAHDPDSLAEALKRHARE